MAKQDISTADIITEMLDAIDDCVEPSGEEGWISFRELSDSAIGLSENMLRDRVQQMVSTGKWEGKKWGRWMYYRVKK